MVRIMIKGGVWKNTEDEILKAAVMKYGKSQWARVASLMSRKSAKQCKARWYEWLDPSIKKTDWTREEEEKLLHLSKLMPQQWRTIAPLVGRTAAQCLEHYERLLAQAEESAEGGDGAASGAGVAPADDPRRLRPGEIDPNPENKPARPDPVDMDEDEKEMLSEARARLSNTKGKKAKRKAREKQLEEARRLASLQKRRELKAAGIDLERRQRRRRDIDLGREIPFQKTAPAGFYDVSEERRETKRARLDGSKDVVFMQQLEEKRRKEEEEALRKADARKIKKLMQANLPQAVVNVSEKNDPLTVRRRVPLSLPTPVMSDGEFEAVLRRQVDADGGGVGGGGGRLALPTPMRTPSVASGENAIMQEARNLARLVAGQTPLLGGDALLLEGGMGFAGATPRSSRITTPHPMAPTPGATPGHAGNGADAGGATPLRTPQALQSGRRGGGGSSMAGTPLRDELGLNSAALMTPSAMSLASASSAREVKARQQQQRAELKSKLAQLPEPQYEVSVAARDDIGGEDDDESDVAAAAAQREEDAAERDRRLEELRRAQEQAEFRARSTVVRRGLPRPAAAVVAQQAKAIAAAAQAAADALAAAEALVLGEMATMVRHDARQHPPDDGGAAKKRKRRRQQQNDNGAGTADDGPVELLEPFSEEELMAAKLLLADEAGDTATAAAADARGRAAQPGDPEALAAAWRPRFESWFFVPSRGEYLTATTSGKEERLEALQNLYDGLRGQLVSAGARAAKMEGRIAVQQGGYEQRAEALVGRLVAAAEALQEGEIAAASYAMLKEREDAALPRRLTQVHTAAASEGKAEAELQDQYGELVRVRDHLSGLLERAELEATAAAAAAEAAATAAAEGGRSADGGGPVTIGV
ncbi:unnamed protein product [Phaeothamnion confervicola]